MISLCAYLGTATLLAATQVASGPQGRALSDHQHFGSIDHNVLVIVADDVGVDMIGAYGESTNAAKTPSIDSLAAGGILFRNAWANPICSPTRAVIQTGRYGFRYGLDTLVFPVGQALPYDEVTLPEMLDIGTGGRWSSAAIGKWHLGNESVGGELAPNFAGYHHFRGHLGNFPTGFDYFQHPMIDDGQFSISTNYATSEHTDSAIEWIRTAEEPWICYLAYNAAHTPTHLPPGPLHTQHLPPPPAHTPKPTPYFRAMVEAMDTEIGRLLNTLDPPTLAKTTIIFIGDNGTPEDIEAPPFPSNQGKLTPYERGVNVPLIVSSPLVNRTGREVQALVHAVDIFATVAEIAEVDPVAVQPVPRIVDSVSLVPYLERHDVRDQRDTVFAEIYFPSSPGTPEYRRYAIRGKRYKLIRDPIQQNDELFDLAADPFEQNNLLLGPLTFAQSREYTTLSDELIALLSNP